MGSISFSLYFTFLALDFLDCVFDDICEYNVWIWFSDVLLKLLCGFLVLCCYTSPLVTHGNICCTHTLFDMIEILMSWILGFHSKILIWDSLSANEICFPMWSPLFFVITWYSLKMSPFKRSAVKGGSSKRKELVIDLESLTPKTKKSRSSTGFYDASKFRSYAASQAYENYFMDAPMLVERVLV